VHGHIVVLNGASSAGKTTIARSVRTLCGERCVVLSIDQFFSSVHPERKHDWALFRSLSQILFDAARSAALQGFDVVVDTVFERPECDDICRATLAGLTVSRVGLTCPTKVLERRELQRGDRPPGLAARQSGHVHEGCVYDMELDTSAVSAEQCAQRIAGQLMHAASASPVASSIDRPATPVSTHSATLSATRLDDI
jgi:chloramphenicol 3-O phosphotransferase